MEFHPQHVGLARIGSVYHQFVVTLSSQASTCVNENGMLLMPIVL
jgi:hypothetical protein